VSDYSVEPDSEIVLKKISQKDFEPKRMVYLQRDPRIEQGGDRSPLPQASVQVQLYSPNRVDLVVETSQAGFVVLADTYAKGWSAFVDDKQAPIYRANTILRSVWVPEGKHTISYVYDPVLFKIGLYVGVITLFLILCYMIMSLVRRKKYEKKA